jgi:hypothetical protein
MRRMGAPFVDKDFKLVRLDRQYWPRGWLMARGGAST